MLSENPIAAAINDEGLDDLLHDYQGKWFLAGNLSILIFLPVCCATNKVAWESIESSNANA